MQFLTDPRIKHNMAVKYTLLIFAVCTLVQALDATNAQNASANAHKALEKLDEATIAVFRKEIGKFDKKLDKLKADLEKSVANHKEHVFNTTAETKDTFTKLQKKAQEKNVEIAECLDGKIDEINGFGLKMMGQIEECATFCYKASGGAREVLSKVYMDIRGEGTDFKIDSTQCKDDECFNGIADEAKKMLKDLSLRSSSIFRYANRLLDSWLEEVGWCYLHPGLNYHNAVEKTVKTATDCANEKIQ